jgi:hypothetical protein
MKFTADVLGCEFTSSHFEGGRQQLRVRGGCLVSSSKVYAPFSTASQIVVDGARNIVHLHYAGNSSYPLATILELGATTSADTSDIFISYGQQTGASGALVKITGNGGQNKIVLQGYGSTATSSTAYTGTLFSSDEITIKQAWPGYIYVNQVSQGLGTVKYPSWTAKARYGEYTGAASVSFNAVIASGLSGVTQDDTSIGSTGIVCRSGDIVFVGAAAGSTSLGQYGVIQSGGSWLIGSATGGSEKIRVTSTGISFFGGSSQAKKTVTGSHGGNAALQSLLTALADYGLITNSTTA